MIISPPLLKAKGATETDATWIERVMTEAERRGFPTNAHGSWHGGIHIRHTDAGNSVESVRAIADGTVVSLRQSSGIGKRDLAPLNLNADKPGVKGSDDGYVLLKHETQIGSGEDAKVVFYSLYMHLKSLESTVKAGEKVCRKDPLGTSGMVDAVNAFHFQIFCDDDNISKLTGRNTRELDVSKDGRTDAVYGNIHFYLPFGTKFYDKAPVNNVTSTDGLTERCTTTVPLYVSMTLEKGSCTIVTRQKDAQIEGKYLQVGESLVDADGKNYEYNLYKTAMAKYKDSPSAGFELLRFGRVINTEHETLVPGNAPLWMTVSYSGGQGVVNLANPNIKKFSDADFPHWTGWQLIDNDADSNSQCNSAAIAALNKNGDYDNQCGKLICHFPFEWEKSTVDARFSWLKTGSDEHDPMSEESYAKFKAHAEALCFESGAFSSGRLWHFEPKSFIRHFRKCNWLSQHDFIRTIRRSVKNESTLREEGRLTEETVNEHLTLEKEKTSGVIIRPSEMGKNLALIMRRCGVNSTLRLAHFLSQIYCETGRVSECEERGKDSYFDKYEPDFDLKHKNKNELSKKLGNDQVGDGIKFKGRGVIQLTGRANYKMYGEFKGDNTKFISSDGAELLISSSYYCCDAGGFYWIQKQRMKMHNKKLVNWGALSIHYWADQGTAFAEVKAVTKCVNGGSNGLDSIRWPCFEHAYYALNDSTSPNNNVKFIS